ncbi:MAG: hypothetical protein LAO18_24245 [Acidobacteriia bacterium]|nr:hypothetical protein [Terriglobia bacterium]
MLRKNQRPFISSVGCAQQLSRNTHCLREVNRAALRELRRIGDTDLTHTQYREASESVGISASRMILLLRYRQEILATGREQGVQLFQLILGSSDCENCAEIRRLELGCNEPVSEETLKNDPEYQKEIESLLEFALRTERRVFARYKLGRAVPSMFFTKVSSLISAVIRQQQQLRDMTIRQQPEIELCFEECASCALPIETNEQEDKD